MAYESWYICDVCGKRVKSDRKSDDSELDSWLSVEVEPHNRWNYNDKDGGTYLDLSVCSLDCATKAIMEWAEAGYPKQLPDEDTPQATV